MSGTHYFLKSIFIMHPLPSMLYGRHPELVYVIVQSLDPSSHLLATTLLFSVSVGLSF
jgi:hypothetical protein